MMANVTQPWRAGLDSRARVARPVTGEPGPSPCLCGAAPISSLSRAQAARPAVLPPWAGLEPGRRGGLGAFSVETPPSGVKVPDSENTSKRSLESPMTRMTPRTCTHRDHTSRPLRAIRRVRVTRARPDVIAWCLAGLDVTLCHKPEDLGGSVIITY